MSYWITWHSVWYLENNKLLLWVVVMSGASWVAQTVKNMSAVRGPSFDPWFEKIWRREWQPTPVFLPGKSHGQRSLVGHSPWGLKESDTTEQLTLPLAIQEGINHLSSILPSSFFLPSLSPKSLKPWVLYPDQNTSPRIHQKNLTGKGGFLLGQEAGEAGVRSVGGYSWRVPLVKWSGRLAKYSGNCSQTI